jgi:hypothetical protein
VPRCRTMMPPALTVCPSERFTPRYFGCESLRFLAVPPAFFFAITLLNEWYYVTAKSIRYMWDKFKSMLTDDAVFYAALVIMVGIISFGLGRLSQTVEKPLYKSSNAISELQPLVVPEVDKSDDTAVVASRSGTKYHLPDCPGAKQMKADNKIEFTSTDEARAAGYEPAGNCPGL